MAIYRLYCMDGGAVRDAEWFEADGDAAALATATEMRPDALRCEVWCGTRFVGAVSDSERGAVDKPKRQGA